MEAKSENSWISWHGGRCPIPDGVTVRVKFRDGHTDESRSAGTWDWKWNQFDSSMKDDIVYYKVICFNQYVDLDKIINLLTAVGYTVTKQKTIDDIEPQHETLKLNDNYYIPNPIGIIPGLTNSCIWGTDMYPEGTPHDLVYLHRGLCYSTKGDAEIAAQAMIKLKGGIV